MKYSWIPKKQLSEIDAEKSWELLPKIFFCITILIRNRKLIFRFFKKQSEKCVPWCLQTLIFLLLFCAIIDLILRSNIFQHRKGVNTRSKHTLPIFLTWHPIRLIIHKRHFSRNKRVKFYFWILNTFSYALNKVDSAKQKTLTSVRETVGSTKSNLCASENNTCTVWSKKICRNENPGRGVTAIQRKIMWDKRWLRKILLDKRWMRWKNLFSLVVVKLHNFTAEFSGEITLIHCFEKNCPNYVI